MVIFPLGDGERQVGAGELIASTPPAHGWDYALFEIERKKRVHDCVITFCPKCRRLVARPPIRR
jgi:hypothetical protein